MNKLFVLLLSVVMIASFLTACGGNSEDSSNTTPGTPIAETPTEKELSPSEKLMAKYTEIANEQTSLAESVAKKSDMTVSGKFSRLAIDLTDIATALAKGGDALSETELSALDAKLEKCKTTLEEIKKLLEE